MEDFLNKLKSFGIGGYSERIPPGVGVYNKGVPNESDLISVPLEEDFPLPPVEPHHAINPEEIKTALIQSQYEILFTQLETAFTVKSASDELELLEYGREYENPEELHKFKRALATYYNEQAKNLGCTKPVEICSEPTCLNMAIPSFKYCSNHILNEQKPQPFIKKCGAPKPEGEDAQECQRPAPSGVGLCLHHLNK